MLLYTQLAVANSQRTTYNIHERRIKMLAWLMTNIASVAAALVIAVIAGLVIAYLINNKRKGRTSCGCGCNCSCCSGGCHEENNPQ